MKKTIFCIAALAITVQSASAQVTGRQLQTIGATTGTTTLESATDTTEVFNVRPVIGLFWDDRCTKVSFTFNSSLTPNAGTVNEISPEDTVNTIQAGLDRWNANPSSYIEMNVDNTEALGNRTRIGGDFINEVVFIAPDAFNVSFASSISTPLLEDTTFIAGEDFDGDGDSDVYDPQELGLNVCADVDSDGDIEFPAGDYKAGTILDNDVQFRQDLDWSLEASDSPEIDIDNLSVHEFGHSHGLSHSMINQISASDASGATMYPFTDNTDGAVELETRSLYVDDLAASAFLYPEGRGSTPSSSLQAGDIAFEDAYTVLTGNVTSGDGTPILSAAVSAVNNRGERLTQTFSGANTSLIFESSTGFLGIFDESVTANAGQYELPVPVRNLITANIEALDGFPLSPGNINTEAVVAGFSSTTDFPEETSDLFESANEARGGPARRFFSFPRRAPSPLDFILNEEEILTNALSENFAFNSRIIGATDIVYAELFDREIVLEILANNEVFTGGTFTSRTFFGNRSSIPDFNSARLVLGTVNSETGEAELGDVIDADNEFVAQEQEISPYQINQPKFTSIRLALKLLENPELQVFLVTEANDIVPNRNDIPNALLSQSNTSNGTSFLSIDGAPLTLIGGTWNVELRSTFDEDSRIPDIIDAFSRFSSER